MGETSWTERALEPFGMDIGIDLGGAWPAGFAERMIALFEQHKLLVFRRQSLSEAEQVHVLDHFGRVLGSHGEYRKISSDGALGSGPLTWHSDLAFTEEPFKVISLHAVAVNDGQSWTAFANGVETARALPSALQDQLGTLQAVTTISAIQTHRALGYDTSAELPHQTRPVLIPHPRTGEPVLYISDMQTNRIEGLPREASDDLLARLFDELYRPERIYRHTWNQGDLVIWDNIALQHSRGDLTGMTPRELQRVVVADKSFFDLLPQFKVGDANIDAWSLDGKELTFN